MITKSVILLLIKKLADIADVSEKTYRMGAKILNSDNEDLKREYNLVKLLSVLVITKLEDDKVLLVIIFNLIYRRNTLKITTPITKKDIFQPSFYTI